MDYLLRTTVKAQLDAALEAAGLLVEVNVGDGSMMMQTAPGVYLDRIGPIPAVYDIDGNMVSRGHPEYHANLRVTFDLTDEQIGVLPTFDPLPAIPYRVFA
jgi:hypothetical protein